MKKLLLVTFLFGFMLRGCQDPTLEEVEDIACTSCVPEAPPPPSNDD